MSGFTGVDLDPLLPWPVLALMAVLALGLVGYALWQRARGAWWRLAAFAIGLAALANPSLVEEQRQPEPDIALIVTDRSPSMGIGERNAQATQAEAALKQKLAALPGLEVRTIEAGAASPDGRDDGTRLFDAAQRALSDTPRERVAGVVVISDGQVHDAPEAAAAQRIGGPVHTLLVGAPDERDRRLVVEQAPAYGLVGHDVTVQLKIEDDGAAPGASAPLTIRVDNGESRIVQVPIGRTYDLPVRLDHGGPTIVELGVPPGERELTLLNNRAVVTINGVRDRLRVLLVTGEPHPGQRVWRNLLKADPSVDLVHFTILRPAEKQDGTPIRELSLIAFPIRELFELKIAEFDLIIFDRYRRRGILPNQYFQNIVDYVRNGGALLEASGPAYSTALSLFRSPLADILPSRPTGSVHVERYRPHLTEIGRRHPVTEGLEGSGENGGEPTWGAWFRLVDAEAGPRQTLLAGPMDRPALVLDRVGKGRVAQVLSDHGWLWARGFDGGGPQAELLRRTAHWLMKEPELEEEGLSAQVKGNRIEVTRRALEADERPVNVTMPDERRTTMTLAEQNPGRSTGTIPADQPGVWRFDDGRFQAIAAVGALNPKEFADPRATTAKMTPVAEATRGGVRWLKDGMPDFRRVSPDRPAEGRGWLGMVAHGDYLVTGIRRIGLMPGLAVLALALAALMLAWRREGR